MNKGDTIIYTYFKNNKVYFVVGYKEIMFQPMPAKYDVCIKNGNVIRYDSLENITIEDISWKTVAMNDITWGKMVRDGLEWTFLYILSSSGDRYYFFCDLGVFNCITKLYDTSETSFLDTFNRKFYNWFGKKEYQKIG